MLVLVTDPEFHRAPAAFAAAAGITCTPAPADEAPLAAMVRARGVRAVILGHQPYRGALYDAVPCGGILARFGVGYDGLDLARATAAGLYCTNTPGVLDQSVAELTMLLVAAAARGLTSLSASMTAAHAWAPREGIELAGRTLAIVGCGRIGRAVARIARLGYGMRVVGFQRASRRPPAPEALLAFDRVTADFADAVRDADFVSVHIPGSPDNARFLDAARLAACRPGAWIVNTARGAVIDEAALYDAIAAGRLGGAALDVFAREPYVPVDPARDLRSLDRVILTPHVGSHTQASNRRMAERAILNVVRALAGDIAGLDLLNRDVVRA